MKVKSFKKGNNSCDRGVSGDKGDIRFEDGYNILDDHNVKIRLHRQKM